MKILLVVSSYLPNLGGLQSVTSALAQELAKQGHDVRVLTQRYPRTLPAREIVNDIPVERLLFLVPRLETLRVGRADLFFAALFYFPVSLARMTWLLWRWKPEVVNLHFVGAPAIFVLLAARLFGFPLVVSLHGDDVEGLPQRDSFQRRVLIRILRRAVCVTACSGYLLKKACEIEPVCQTKGMVIHNGFEMVSIIHNHVSEDTALGVGRLMPSKGWDILVAAWGRIAAETKYCLGIIGDGPLRTELEKLVAQGDGRSSVKLHGLCEREFVLQAMARARFIVIPSRRETFGMVALEAMAAGKPILATCVGGLPEVLADADALLVPPEDVNALARGIRAMQARLAADPSFGARNRAVAARFSLSRMVEAYARVYTECLGQP